MSTSTFLQIKELLEENKIPYKHLTHEPVTTSQQAAEIRGTRLEDAAKALILKIQDTNEIIQIVLPANERLDLKKVKNLLNVKNASLASPEEVLEKTGCTIGSVPPFGVLWNIPMYVDEDILKKEEIVFSAGTHTDSIQISPTSYIELVNAKIVELKKE